MKTWQHSESVDKTDPQHFRDSFQMKIEGAVGKGRHGEGVSGRGTV